MKRKILFSLLLAFLSYSAARAQCYAGFVYYNAPGSTTVNFYDSSMVTLGSITGYSWDFGDNSNGTGANPVHSYNSVGTYGVMLTITTSTGCNSTYYDTVFVGVPQCNMYAYITHAQLVQTLTANVVGGTPPYTYNWPITGGTGQSTQAFSPGIYCVSITDMVGCVTSACYTVTSSSACQASFLTQTNPGSSTVSFIDSSSTSIGTISSYTWSFGDGGNAYIANPTHTYNSIGTYLVTLTINTSNGCSSTDWDTVYVGTQPCNLTANLSYDAQNGFLNAQVNNSTGPYTYIWSPSVGLSNPTISNPAVSVTFPTTYCVSITDTNGCSFQGCIVASPANTDTICGNVFNDVNGNGIQDSTELPGYGFLNIYGNNGQYYAYVDSSTGHYSAAVPAGTYSIWFCTMGTLSSFSIPADDSSGCAFYNNVVIAGGGMHCGYNFGIQYNQGFIEGDIFVDANNNGLFDSNESAIPYQSVHAGNYWGYTNQNGHYQLTVLPGTYTVSFSPSGIYAGYALSTPSSYSCTVTNSSTSSNNNFGIYVIPGSTNLSVSIIPHTTVTPGFPSWYDIYVNNVGANATTATLTMQYDAALNFTNATPTQTSVNTSTKTISWNIPLMAPGTSRSFYVRFTANVGITLGASTLEFVDVVANNGIDVNLSNNFDSVHQTITGSWDPNNKLVVSSNYNDPSYQVISSLNPNQTIDYTINFQNTGNAPAVNVSVLDDLSADLDASSFVLLGASHTANVSRNGNHLSFVFPNIMLEDSTHNEPASHGFINFRVNANAGLSAGHTILDKADIYFDFNAPVATNDANLLLINPLGIPTVNAADAGFISPNPIRDFFTVNLTLSSMADVNCTVRSIDGRVVKQLVFNNQTSGAKSLLVDASDLSEGVYMIEFTDGKKIRIIKAVKTN